jgi:hypothetical protein
MSNLPPGFEPHPRFDFFEPGDKTAMICMDVPEMQRLVIQELDELGYKVHTGLFLDDSVLKLRTHAYDVVIVSEFFQGSTLENHPIIAEAIATPASQRRKQVYVLVGASLVTNDDLLAFYYNVDVVVSLQDVMNLKPVLRRAVTSTVEFYSPLQEVLAAINAAELGLHRTASASAL